MLNVLNARACNHNNQFIYLEFHRFQFIELFRAYIFRQQPRRTRANTIGFQIELCVNSLLLLFIRMYLARRLLTNKCSSFFSNCAEISCRLIFHRRLLKDNAPLHCQCHQFSFAFRCNPFGCDPIGPMSDELMQKSMCQEGSSNKSSAFKRPHNERANAFSARSFYKYNWIQRTAAMTTKDENTIDASTSSAKTLNTSIN